MPSVAIPRPHAIKNPCAHCVRYVYADMNMNLRGPCIGCSLPCGKSNHHRHARGGCDATYAAPMRRHVRIDARRCELRSHSRHNPARPDQGCSTVHAIWRQAGAQRGDGRYVYTPRRLRYHSDPRLRVGNEAHESELEAMLRGLNRMPGCTYA